jgi:hypothetical protein
MRLRLPRRAVRSSAASEAMSRLRRMALTVERPAGEKALEHAASLAPIIARLDPDGSLSLRALASTLTAEGLPTPAGAAVWTAATAARVKARLSV